MRYAIFFAYDGTAYHGWQTQPDAITVQQRMEEALSLLLRTKISVVGAGRTDTGVHARQMACHFDFDTPLDTPQFARRLNAVLPPDIAIHHIDEVSPQWHARFSATSRTYHYYITTRKDPFNRPYA
ncbi:MAG: tRNA pseudouridine synthase A, partial [Bacteroidaceae bacterium]